MKYSKYIFLVLFIIISIMVIKYSVYNFIAFLAAFVIGYTFVKTGVGFTGAIRNALVNGKSAGIRLLIAVSIICTFLFFPFGYIGSFFSFKLDITPAGIDLALFIGAFLFGIGMQLSGACASGCTTLAASANLKIFLALIFFIIGSVFGAMHFHVWKTMPNLGSISLIQNLKILEAISTQVIILGIFYIMLLYNEKAKQGKISPIITSDKNGESWPRWTMLVAMPIGAFIIFVTKGTPWGITSAFVMWGAKIGDFLSLIDVTQYPYWSDSSSLRGFHESIFENNSSVTTLALLLGSAIAASLLGKWDKINFHIPLFPTIAAIIGGLLMGYGARLAGGCNIGALMGGIVIGDLSFLFWLGAAILGNMVGIFIRPIFKLTN